MHMSLCTTAVLLIYSKVPVTPADTEHEVNFDDCWYTVRPTVNLLMSNMRILQQFAEANAEISSPAGKA